MEVINRTPLYEQRQQNHSFIEDRGGRFKRFKGCVRLHMGKARTVLGSLNYTTPQPKINQMNAFYSKLEQLCILSEGNSEVQWMET